MQTSVFLHASGPDALDIFKTFKFEEEGDEKKLDIVLEKFEQYRHCSQTEPDVRTS